MRALVLALLFAALSAQADEFILIPAAGGGGGGGAPVYQTGASGARSTSSTSLVHNMPASLSSGDYLILAEGVTSDVSASITCPDDGSTTEYTRTISTSTGNTLQICRKVSDGSDSTTANWTGADGNNGASLRVTGVTGTVTVSSASSGSSTTPDPPTVSFTAPALLLVICGGTGEDDNLSTAIGGSWSQIVHVDGGANAQVPWVHVEQCTANSGTDCDSGNPGTFTMATSTSWACRTIALED